MSAHKILKGLAIASVVAIVTPAAGAGLVAATAEGAMVVADVAAVPALRTSTYEEGEEGSYSGPARLSPLAGNDSEAWASARDVGFIARPKRKLR